MEFEQKVLEVLNSLMTYLYQPKSVLDVIVEYVVPILGAVILVLTSMAAVIKYYREKNRDYYEKILNEVYAPLYQYIIKQEYVRHLKPDEMSIEEYPIISLTNRKTTVKNLFTQNGTIDVEESDIIKNTDLLQVKSKLNFGLVPQDLLVLINSYEMANVLQKNVPEDEFKAIEVQLRESIIEGYEKYKRKIGLSTTSKLIKRKGNKIKFLFVKEQ